MNKHVFETPKEAANWIKDNEPDEEKQEKLMYICIANKHLHGTYTLYW